MPKKPIINARTEGARGGRQTISRYGADYMADIAEVGGNVTRERHGIDHFKNMGKKSAKLRKQKAAQFEMMRKALKRIARGEESGIAAVAPDVIAAEALAKLGDGEVYECPTTKRNIATAFSQVIC